MRDIPPAGLARVAVAVKLPALAAAILAWAVLIPAIADAASTQAPTVAASFTPNQIDVTGSSSIEYTITDPNSAGTLYNVSFTDTLPAGVALDNPATETDSGCTSSTVSAPVVSYTADPGSSTITVVVPQVKSGTPCTVQFPVLASAAGNGSDSFLPGSSSYATSATGSATALPATAETTAALQVIPEPTVSVTGVKAGASYRYGQAVTVRYSCAQPELSAGIATCTASDDLGDNVKSGQKLATKLPGKHSLTVQAIDAIGDVFSDEVDYTVLPDNVFTIGRLTAHAGGSLGLTLALPGAGAVTIKEFAGSTLVSSKSAKVHGKTKLAQTLAPTRAGAKLLARGGVKVKLQVTYTPTGGRKNTVTRSGIST